MSLTVAVTGLNAGENPQPGTGVVRSLRRSFDDITIIGLVYGSLESGVFAEGYCDAVYQIPYPSSGVDALLERFDYILSCRSIDLFIPTLDAEIVPLINAQAAFEKRGVKMMLPSLKSFNARAKDQLVRLAEKANVKLPETASVCSVDDLHKESIRIGYPLVMKGPYYDAVKIYQEPELHNAFHRIMGQWGGPVLLQQYISGEEFNIAAVGDGQGNLSASCCIRKSIRSEKGKGFGGVVIEEPELMILATRLVGELKWNGPLELEFIQDEMSGDFYLLEINPRFPAWIDFPSSIGYNLPALVVQQLLDDAHVEIVRECPVGYFFLRHAVDVAGRIEDLGKLTTYGELLIGEKQ